MRVLRRLLDTLQGTDETVHADMMTAFGRTQVYDVDDADGQALRVLDVEGTWQSGSYRGSIWSELAFAYHRRFEDAIFGCGAPVERILMLGGGALSYPKHVVTHHEHVVVEVVEVDPAITELARRYFYLDRLSASQAARLCVRHDDAASYLASHAAAGGNAYDVIINDAFAAFQAPRSLASPATARRAHALLAPEGLYVANVVSAIKGERAAALEGATASLARSFTHVWVMSLGSDEPHVPDNNVVIASDAAYSFPGALTSSELLG